MRQQTQTKNRTIDTSVFEHRWQPVLPSDSQEISAEIGSEEFEQELREMLDNYDALIPEQYDGFDQPYVPLGKRKQVMEAAFMLKKLLIQVRIIGVMGEDTVAQATLYVMTEKGYQPMFSRFGVGSADTQRADGPAGQAKVCAERRILTALGLGGDRSEEINEVNEETQRQWIKGYLAEQGSDTGQALKKLIAACNAQQTGKQSVRTDIKELPQLNTAEVALLSQTVSKLRQ